MATTGLTQPAPAVASAAASARPVASWRDDFIAMAIGVWPLTALAFDGRAHNNFTGQDSFFSTPHLFLYSGLTVLALWISWVVAKHQLAAGADVTRGRVDLGAVPVGYGIAIVGLVLLALGGPSDFLWHAAYGFEVGVDAVYSPPHLVLFTGGALVGSTGIRSMWAKRGSAPDLLSFAPVILSTAMTVFMVSFIGMYMSAFMTNVTPTEAFTADIERLGDAHRDEGVGLNSGLTSYGDEAWPYQYYSVGHGMAAMVITTAILVAAALLLLRRWRPPFGAVAASYLGFGLLFAVLSEYRDAILLVSLVVAGATVDVLSRRLRPAQGATASGLRLIGAATGATLSISYYIVMAIDEGIGWGAPVLAGGIVVATLTGLAVGVLVAPPSVPEAALEEGSPRA